VTSESAERSQKTSDNSERVLTHGTNCTDHHKHVYICCQLGHLLRARVMWWTIRRTRSPLFRRWRNNACSVQSRCTITSEEEPPPPEAIAPLLRSFDRSRGLETSHHPSPLSPPSSFQPAFWSGGVSGARRRRACCFSRELLLKWKQVVLLDPPDTASRYSARMASSIPLHTP
jgi:hypothetical protein